MCHRCYPPCYGGYCFRRRYTFLGFLGDCFMTCITGGLWLIWCIVRYINNHSY